MKKRFWACFLSLSLVLTMMPTMAFAADDEVNEPEGTVEVCVETEGCTLEAGHEGECVVVESKPEEPESAPCKVTEGCTLEDGHEGDCVVAGSEIKHEVKQQIETIVEAENTPLQFLQMKGDIFVKTEQELRDAISNASQDSQNPTIIWVEDDITLTQSLTIESDRFVELNGNDYSISRDDSYTTDVATSLLVVQGSLITRDVILDAKCTENINGFRVVQVDGNFTMYDTVIQNGYLNGGGANVLIASPDACFTMYSGRICNGHGANGGGVFVYGGGSGGTFYMYGGEISNNTGTHYGSAVVVYNAKSKAYLYNGKIIDNVADRSAEGTDSNWGGAIFINGKDTTYIGGTLEMSGNYAQYAPNGEKEISYFDIFCTAGSNAGTNYPNFISELKNPLKIKYAYFYQNDCTAAIGAEGYTLTTNDLDLLELVDVAGLLYYDADKAEIRGTSQIDAVTLNDNYSDISQTLYVHEGQNIILPENPFKRTGYKLTGWNTKPDGKGAPFTNGAELDNALFSDGLTLYAQWEKCVHASENYKYTAEENTLTQICEDCNTALGSIAIFAPSDDLSYDGQMKNALVKTDSWKGDVPSIVYTQDDVKVMPINVGDYTASITVEDATASVDFAIKKAETNLAITPSSAEISGGGKVILSIVGVPDEGKVFVTCDNENIKVIDNDDGTYSVTLPNETANYTFTAIYDGDKNHEMARATCTVSVTRHTGGGGASHPEASDDSSSDRNDRDDDDTENIDEEDVPLTEGKVADFDDVPADAWFAEAVQYVYEHDLMTGVSENLFAPNAQMNRAMVAQILFNVEKPADTEAPAAFRDVAADQWYAKAVNWAVWQGYMSGYGAGSFGPNDALTREQLVTVLWRYSGSPVMGDSSMLNTFSDAAMTSDYAQQAMTWAYAQGVISGNADGTLNPQGTATRAEVATILMRFYENMAE